jgi:hypothetical protein
VVERVCRIEAPPLPAPSLNACDPLPGHLALEFNESFICEVETLCQDCRNVQEYDGIFHEQVGPRDARKPVAC